MAQDIGSLSPQDALIAVMFVTSAADESMSEREFREIAAMVELLPIFENYDRDRMRTTADMVVDLMGDDDGIDTLMGMVHSALPDHLQETAYALACDVAAADGTVALSEMRLLEIMRHILEIDRLNAAAIERGSRARHMRA